MKKFFIKNHINFKRYKKPSSWLIISHNTKESLIISKSKKTKLLKPEHIKAVLFYIKKYLGRKQLRPRFLVKPRYWLTSKAKASRMGKGKGSLDSLFLYIRPGVRLLLLPPIQALALLRILRSLKIRFPFTINFFNSTD